MTTMKTLKRQILSDALRAHAFAIERTGYQSEHERQLVVDMRAAAAELSPPPNRGRPLTVRCPACGATRALDAIEMRAPDLLPYCVSHECQMDSGAWKMVVVKS